MWRQYGGRASKVSEAKSSPQKYKAYIKSKNSSFDMRNDKELTWQTSINRNRKSQWDKVTTIPSDCSRYPLPIQTIYDYTRFTSNRTALDELFWMVMITWGFRICLVIRASSSDYCSVCKTSQIRASWSDGLYHKGFTPGGYLIGKKKVGLKKSRPNF